MMMQQLLAHLSQSLEIVSVLADGQRHVVDYGGDDPRERYQKYPGRELVPREKSVKYEYRIKDDLDEILKNPEWKTTETWVLQNDGEYFEDLDQYDINPHLDLPFQPRVEIPAGSTLDEVITAFLKTKPYKFRNEWAFVVNGTSDASREIHYTFLCDE